jgi:uncharacterized protein (TIGR03084 family)
MSTREPNVAAALHADGREVDALVADLAPADWSTPTPAPGWTVAHQVAHLAATFRMAGLAAADPAAFQALASRLGPNFDANVDAALRPYLTERPAVLLARFRAERAVAEHALASVPTGQTVPWLVRPLPAPVLAAAGMMELFGHGQDIADALGIRRRYTDRIRFLVEFAVRTWDFGYLSRGLPAPAEPFGFELTGVSGDVWTFGPPEAAQRISGPAVDFCLLVSRRRHRADLALRAAGAQAEQWLDLAQAYRGPAGPGRSPGQFAAVH